MKIKNITPLVLGTPWRNLTFLKVETDEGLVGVSEGRNVNRTEALLGYLEGIKKRYVVGSDPFRIEELVHRIFVGDFARVDDIAGMGIALVEMACWDIVGKALKQPVYQLLGGAVRDKIKAYANGWYTVEREPKAFHEAAKKVVQKGYKALKVDPFGAGLYEMERSEKNRSISLVEAIRDSVGPDVEILIEMHGRFSPATAIELSRDLEPFKPSWVEEPVPPDNLEAMAKAASKINIPVATGENNYTRWEFRDLCERRAATFLMPDVCRAGGFSETLRIGHIAASHGLALTPHLIHEISIHVVGALSNGFLVEYVDWAPKDLWEEAPACRDGMFRIPDRPGHGIALAKGAIEKYRSR